MRLFIAIPLSRTLRSAVVNLQNDLYAAGVRGSYSPEENLHLTLAFIGEYPEAEPVLDALERVSFSPFELSPEGLGCFGDLWWAGLKGSAPLEALARRVRRALAEAEIPFERKRFSPHVTLIRRASGKLPGIRIPPASMRVEAFSLMRSDRGKRGMIYTELGLIEARRD